MSPPAINVDFPLCHCASGTRIPFIGLAQRSNGQATMEIPDIHALTDNCDPGGPKDGLGLLLDSQPQYLEGRDCLTAKFHALNLGDERGVTRTVQAGRVGAK